MPRVTGYFLVTVFVVVLLLLLIAIQARSNPSPPDALIAATLSADQAKTLEATVVPSFERHEGRSVRVISLFDRPPDDLLVNGYPTVRDALAKADIILGVPPQFLRRLIQDGKVAALDPYISQSANTALAKPVISSLRLLGNGRLYGISPTFSAAALAYNIDLFGRIGAAPPTKRISWEDVGSLCQTIKHRLPEHYACLSFGPTPYDLAFLQFRQLLDQRGLSLVSSNQINRSPAFSQLWQWYLTMLSTHNVPNFSGNEFWQGRVAMALLDVAVLTDQTQLPGRKQFRIGVLPPPYFEAFPDVGVAYPHNVMVIASNSKHTDTAWAFIWQVLSSTPRNLLPTSQHESLSALPTLYTQDFRQLFKRRYKFDPTPLYQQDGIALQPTLPPPPEVLAQLDFLGLDLMIRTLYGDMTPTDALERFRETGDAILRGQRQ